MTGTRIFALYVILILVSVLLLGHIENNTGKIKHMYVIGPVSEFNTNMASLPYRISKAKANDLVCLHIDTNGGRMDLMYKIANAIKDSKATVITVNEGRAYSAGAVIAIHGDKIVARPGSKYMFHLGRTKNPFTKEITITDYWHPANRQMIIALMTIGKFKEFELSLLKDKQDYWIDGELFTKRFGLKGKDYGICQE